MYRKCRCCGCIAYKPEDTGNPVIDEAFLHIGEKYRLFKEDSYLKTPHSYEDGQGVDCSHFIYFLLRDAKGYDVMEEPFSEQFVKYDVP